MEGLKTLPSLLGVARAGIGKKLFLDLLRVEGGGQTIVWEEFEDDIFIGMGGRGPNQTFLADSNSVLGDVEVLGVGEESSDDFGKGACCPVLPRILPALILVGEKLGEGGSPRGGALEFAPDAPTVLIFKLRWKDGEGLAE